MNVKETAVTNAADLPFFMVNFSYALLLPFRQIQPDYSRNRIIEVTGMPLRQKNASAKT